MGWGRLWVEQVWWKKIRNSVLGAVVFEMAIRLLSRVLNEAFGSMSPKFGNESCVEDINLRVIGLQMGFKAKRLDEKL